MAATSVLPGNDLVEEGARISAGRASFRRLWRRAELAATACAGCSDAECMNRQVNAFDRADIVFTDFGMPAYHMKKGFDHRHPSADIRRAR